MNSILRVAIADGIGNLLKPPRSRLFRASPALCQCFKQLAARTILGNDMDAALRHNDLVQRHNVRVLQLSVQVDLARHHRRMLLADLFDGHFLACQLVCSQLDLAKCALMNPQFFLKKK